MNQGFADFSSIRSSLVFSAMLLTASHTPHLETTTAYTCGRTFFVLLQDVTRRLSCSVKYGNKMPLSALYYYGLSEVRYKN
jgi:hypothetical protein